MTGKKTIMAEGFARIGRTPAASGGSRESQPSIGESGQNGNTHHFLYPTMSSNFAGPCSCLMKPLGASRWFDRNFRPSPLSISPCERFRLP
jgi:hypothetical protein